MACTLTAMTPTTHSTVRIGSILTSNGREGRHATVVADPCEGYPCDAGMFLINTGTTRDPFYTFGLLTGRTRQKWGIDCPTVMRFHVDTIAVDGVILGIPGDSIPGTWVTRPENVVG